MLIKTIRLETEDGSVFSKDAPLLTAASELAYHTMNCSALNAEELRRENGIEVKKKMLNVYQVYVYYYDSLEVFLIALTFSSLWIWRFHLCIVILLLLI